MLLGAILGTRSGHSLRYTSRLEPTYQRSTTFDSPMELKVILNKFAERSPAYPADGVQLVPHSGTLNVDLIPDRVVSLPSCPHPARLTLAGLLVSCISASSVAMLRGESAIASHMYSTAWFPSGKGSCPNIELILLVMYRPVYKENICRCDVILPNLTPLASLCKPCSYLCRCSGRGNQHRLLDCPQCVRLPVRTMSRRTVVPP